MRFDDSLRTVLAADTTSAFGAQSAFRQLVDLVGRGRVADVASVIDRLRALRPGVPASVRAASARSLALVEPPGALVEFFAEDEPAIAAPVLRAAKLPPEDWTALLPKIGPAGRALLRGRDGLPAAVVRSLAAFGATDFTIAHDPSTAGATEDSPTTSDVRPSADAARATEPTAAPAPSPTNGGTFAIADLVERIETFHRVRERAEPIQERQTDGFSLETDAKGVICWVEGIRRAGVVGRTLELVGSPDGRREIAGTVRTGGADDVWDVSAVALFASGRFAGYRGVARRASRAAASSPAIEPEALRRLVHELRTPTNAIAGFAELISTELLGPVSVAHRERAMAIGRDVDALLGAIDDLDISARMDGDALDLSPRAIDLSEALTAATRRASGGDRLRLPPLAGLNVIADERALDRLLFRLAETVAAGAEEPAEIAVRAELNGVAIGWPWRRRPQHEPLLGVDFSLRLAQKLATTLGGTLVIEPDRLTLHLPASFNGEVQATTH